MAVDFILLQIFVSHDTFLSNWALCSLGNYPFCRIVKNKIPSVSWQHQPHISYCFPLFQWTVLGLHILMAVHAFTHIHSLVMSTSFVFWQCAGFMPSGECSKEFGLAVPATLEGEECFPVSRQQWLSLSISYSKPPTVCNSLWRNCTVPGCRVVICSIYDVCVSCCMLWGP